MMDLVFLNPLILAGLAALPVLWFLLRITPPPPKTVVLPTVHFLAGLIPETQTPDRTPWWILLLRLLIAALVIVALARPVYNPAETLPGSGPVRLVIDNGWAAAQTWGLQTQAAEEAVSQAGREGREIYILTTAPVAGGGNPASFGPVTQGEAASILRGLKPLPWPADWALTAKVAGETQGKDIHSIWFADGLDEGGFDTLASALLAQGDLSYTAPAPEKLPLLLRPATKSGRTLSIGVDAPAEIIGGVPASVQAVAEDGRILDSKSITIDTKIRPTVINFDIPETLHSEVSRYKITGRSGVGGIFVLDDRFRKRSVGIVGPDDETAMKPFIESGYYLKRALEPYTTLHTGTVESVLAEDPSVIILPDVGAMPAENLSALENWVREGGLLLRFAGPNMTKEHGGDFLVPVPLRKGLRSTEGSLSWENPPKLKSFPAQSPLHGLDTGEDIAVRQQILPEPSSDLDKNTWAVLDDGTPLITASALDKGLLVMIHTTASPEWSDLALSGTYVEILQRLVSISGKSPSSLTGQDGLLQPVWVLDGFGATRSPDSSVKPIPAAEFSKTKPDAMHPPGMYGHSGFQQVLNLGDHIGELKTPHNIPASVEQKQYGTDYERDLMPFILYAAMALLLFDWLVMIILMTELRLLARFAAVFLLLAPIHAYAQQDEAVYADELYLAYMKSGDPSLDAISRRGLENLASVLKRRTSAEPAGVAALDPETDTLAFFPLIYWPISMSQQALSDKALNNIQSYLDHGGTILFDTRSASADTRSDSILRGTIGALNVPPLAPIAQDHVLTRSFYLIDSFPGLYDSGTLWVESGDAAGRDGVSSIIIGSNDWAGAWAGDVSSRKAEMSYRFGVNIVMYALTGNYKADQVHVPYILERLGQ